MVVDAKVLFWDKDKGKVGPIAFNSFPRVGAIGFGRIDAAKARGTSGVCDKKLGETQKLMLA